MTPRGGRCTAQRTKKTFRRRRRQTPPAGAWLKLGHASAGGCSEHAAHDGAGPCARRARQERRRLRHDDRRRRRGRRGRWRRRRLLRRPLQVRRPRRLAQNRTHAPASEFAPIPHLSEANSRGSSREASCGGRTPPYKQKPTCPASFLDSDYVGARRGFGYQGGLAPAARFATAPPAAFAGSLRSRVRRCASWVWVPGGPCPPRLACATAPPAAFAGALRSRGNVGARRGFGYQGGLAPAARFATAPPAAFAGSLRSRDQAVSSIRRATRRD